MMRSVSFDSAAEEYDATRGFPPGVADQVAEAALDLLGRRRRVVEVGIGTGRIARPLLTRHVNVTGVDLSRGMMAQLLARLPPGSARPALVQGDATALPLPAGSFDAVISVHVFHLIANWRAALVEVQRVLAPGGIFLTGYDWRPPGTPGARLMDRWREIVRAQGPPDGSYAPHDFDDIRAALLAMGASLAERRVGEWTVTRTLARQIETIEHRTWSSTWNVPPDFFPRCLAELRAWAAATFDGLDQAHTVPHRFVWQRFEGLR
jgi:SAM-dependent methyltransferase